MNKHFIWASTILVIVAMLCGTLLWINYNSWILRFEMDDNTKEAIESMEYPIVDIEQPEKICYAITHEVWGVWDTKENIIYNRTVDTGLGWEKVRCPRDFTNGGLDE
ncbi:hypothetical protein KAT51_00940 [bacterium]|nr:hypothetical protein [bacterium]